MRRALRALALVSLGYWLNALQSHLERRGGYVAPTGRKTA